MLSILIGGLLVAALAAGTVTLVCVAFLAVCEVIEKLKEYREIRNKDALNRRGFILKEKLESGHYQVVTGVWDQKTEEIKAGTVYDAATVDSGIANSDELVIYD